MKFSTLYDRHKDDGLTFTEPSRTKQEFSKEADINLLVERYLKTGSWGEAQGIRQPLFDDFTDDMDYREMQNRIIEAQEDFMSLPARTRDFFQNDVASAMEFLADPENHDKARELGMLPPLERKPSQPSPETPKETNPEQDSPPSDQPSS